MAILHALSNSSALVTCSPHTGINDLIPAMLYPTKCLQYSPKYTPLSRCPPSLSDWLIYLEAQWRCTHQPIPKRHYGLLTNGQYQPKHRTLDPLHWGDLRFPSYSGNTAGSASRPVTGSIESECLRSNHYCPWCPSWDQPCFIGFSELSSCLVSKPSSPSPH